MENIQYDKVYALMALFPFKPLVSRFLGYGPYLDRTVAHALWLATRAERGQTCEE